MNKDSYYYYYYYSSRNIPNFRKCVSVKFYQNIHVHIAYYHCEKDQIENRTPNMLISRFKFLLYDYFDSYLIFKTPITQNSKNHLFCQLAETITQNLDMGMI